MTEHVRITESADALLSAIAHYQAAGNTFHRTGHGEDAMLAAHDSLSVWREPAGSMEGAIAAFKWIRDGDMVDDDAGRAVLAAAIAYLEGVNLGGGLMEANSDLMTPDEAAARLRASTTTLQRWRCNGNGPKYIKSGARIFYHLKDIEAYERENQRSQTRG